MAFLAPFLATQMTINLPAILTPDLLVPSQFPTVRAPDLPVEDEEAPISPTLPTTFAVALTS
jgi:hypothetical protein